MKLLEDAAEALREAQPSPPPVADLERRVRRRTRRRLVATGCCLLAVGAVITTALITRDGKHPVAVTTAGPVGHLVPTQLPPGLSLASVFDYPTQVGNRASIRVYGLAGDADPFAKVDVQLMVQVTTGQPGLVVHGGQGDIRGGKPVETSPTQYGATLTWQEDADHRVSLSSHTLLGAELVPIAQGLVFDPVQYLRPSELPDGLTEVGSIADSELGAVPIPADGSGSGVDYAQIDRGLSIVTTLATQAQLNVMLWQLHPTMTDVVVRGHRGWLVNVILGNTLVWDEGSGVIGVASTSRVSTDDLVKAVNSAEPVSQTAWDALKAQTQRGVTTTAVPGASICTSQQINIEFVEVQGATQFMNGVFRVRNTGSEPCYWSGELRIDVRRGSNDDVVTSVLPVAGQEKAVTLPPTSATSTEPSEFATFLLRWHELDVANGGTPCASDPLVPSSFFVTVGDAAFVEVSAQASDGKGVTACNADFGLTEIGLGP